MAHIASPVTGTLRRTAQLCYSRQHVHHSSQRPLQRMVGKAPSCARFHTVKSLWTVGGSARRSAQGSVLGRIGASRVGGALRIPSLLQGARALHASAARRAGSSSGSSSSSMPAPLAWYNTHLEARPLITKMLTGAFLYGAGDTVGQFVQAGDPEPFDYIRLIRAMGFGLLIAAPLNHYGYTVMNHVLIEKLALGTVPLVVAKLVLDQLVFMAPMLIFSYHMWNGLTQGAPPNALVAYVKSVMWQTLKANWILWPAGQLINFAFVPLQYQVTFVMFIAFWWAVYLSWAFGKPPKYEDLLKHINDSSDDSSSDSSTVSA